MYKLGDLVMKLNGFDNIVSEMNVTLNCFKYGSIWKLVKHDGKN